MFFYPVLALVSLVLVSVIRLYLALQRNIAIAKASGLPYIVLPFAPIPSTAWYSIHALVLSIVGKIPGTKDKLWFKVLYPEHSWASLREINDAIGDTYLVVSPSTFFANVASAEAITQIVARRGDFIKPVFNYKSINIFGKNLVTAEGDDFRRHKRIVAPSFSEKSNALVFEESTRQAQGLLNMWARRPGNTPNTLKVEDTASDVAALALHVICGAGFGVPQIWPGEDRSVLGSKIVPGFNTEKLFNNHKMTFRDSLNGVTGGFLWFAAFRPWLLGRSPFQLHKKIYSAYSELGQYFNELFDYKKKRLEVGEEEDKGTMDLLGPLIKASELAAGEENGKSDEKGILQSGALGKDEIVGNAFVILFAGHETAANTLHFSTLLLAVNRQAQEHLQNDIDIIVGSRDPSTWTYANDMRNLYNSMVGAVQNEELRVIPAVTNVHKIVLDSPQSVLIDGKTATFPANTYLFLNVIGTQRNPKYYPHSPSKRTNKMDDMDDFVPERWLLNSEAPSTSAGDVPADGLTNASFESNSSIFRPAKGTFIVFSEGARACPGRRFAQVEITAVLAVFFQRYSVELDVSLWASDEEVRRMNFEQRKELYGTARARAEKLMRESYSIVTLQMRAEKVTVRFVRRGEELFQGC